MDTAERIERDGGFTLIEIMVVAVIIAVLAAIVAPAVLGRVDTAKHNAAKGQIASFDTALSSFRLDTGDFPASGQGLQSLRADPGVQGWDGPYLTKELPKDPWGKDYVYTYPSSNNPGSYEVVCYGKDGQPGGEGVNEDIFSWK